MVVCFFPGKNYVCIAGIRELGVVDLSFEQCSARCDLEAAADCVIFKFEHGRPCSWVLVHHPLDKEQDRGLVSRLEMHLKHAEPLNESINHFS